MRSTTLPGAVPWYRRRSNSWEALRHPPTRSLVRLYLAVFFLFSIYGFFQNLMESSGFLCSSFSRSVVANGAYTVVYPWLLIRHPGRWIWGVMLLQCALVGWVICFIKVKGFHRVPGPLTSLVVTVKAFGFFSSSLDAVAKWGKQQDDQTLLIVRCISNT